jgi:hypothetical protein
VPALEAHDDVGAARQPVDDLALALIAPLGADHGNVGQAQPFPGGTARALGDSEGLGNTRPPIADIRLG